jgi:hypothetical protein
VKYPLAVVSKLMLMDVFGKNLGGGIRKNLVL